MKADGGICSGRRLFRIVDSGHAMVKLAQAVDWARMDELFGATYCPDNGHPLKGSLPFWNLFSLSEFFRLPQHLVVAQAGQN